MNISDARIVQNTPNLCSPVDRLAVLERYRRHVNSGFAKLAEFMGLPIEVSSSKSLVFDENGEAYLDCGGYGVFILGHRHPMVIEAVKAQLERHPLATRGLLNAELAAAAEKLAEVTPIGLDYVCFTNSGAEATELAIKLGRLNGKRRLIATVGGFHGKTMGALSVTGQRRYQKPFCPLLPEVQFVPFGDAKALAKALSVDGEISCVILEPVQGEGGVIIPPEGYLHAVADLCRQYGAFLICDEIQTGLGRLGTWWGVEREKVVPDVLLVGKGLSGGVIPVGAVVATHDAYQALNRDPVLHSSTFAGNPLAMAAAHAAIHAIEFDGLVERAHYLGEKILPVLRQILLDTCPNLVRAVRGIGLLIGIEFEAEHLAGDFMLKLLNRKIIVSHSLNAHKVVRLTPPAVLTASECDWLFESVQQAAIALTEAWS